MGARAMRRLASNPWLGLLVVDLVAIAIMGVRAPAFLSTFNLYVVSRDVSITLLVAFSR